MATIRKEITLDAPLVETWAAFADYHAVDRRLAPGFVVKCEANDGGRTVTFANGIVANERLVTMDHAGHRLVYSVQGGRLAHHNASFHLAADGSRTRLVWLADILPDELAPAIGGMMEDGCTAMQRQFNGGGA
ncbi:MAG: SRPBCC family protein [Reyranellaceae bacterium]